MVGPRTERELPWTHFVRRCGGPAIRWVSEYGGHDELLRDNFQALVLIRQQHFAEGWARSIDIESRIRQTTDPGTSMRWVLERFLYSVRGYYFYCLGDSREAARCMDRAHDSIVRSIEIDPFLVTLAESCHEFALHHARIARNDKRWDAMFHHIERTRRMMTGDAPLCTLGNGVEIDFSVIAQFYRSLGTLDEAERESIGPMLTAESRLVLFEDFVRRIVALPGFAVQYP